MNDRGIDLPHNMRHYGTHECLQRSFMLHIDTSYLQERVNYEY